MAVASTDLIFYLAANRPEDDSGTSGGAISTVRLMDRSKGDSINSGNGDRIDVVSDGTDTRTVILAGYGTDGAWLSETVNLNGASHVQSTATFKHLKKCVASATSGSRTVTVARYASGSPVTLFTIPVNETGAAAIFLRATAQAQGGSAKDFYEKLFVKNCHASDALTAGVIWLSEDEAGELKMDLEKSSNATVTGGSETTGNRATEPTTGGTYSWGDHASQGAGHTLGDAEDGNLVAGETQGIWLKLTLAAGKSPDPHVQFTANIAGSAS